MIKVPFPHIWQMASAIPSTLTYNESEMLYNCALTNEKGAIVEIGSYVGRSSVCLGMAAKQTKKHVFCIDHFNGDEHSGFFTQNLYPYWKKNIQNMRLHSTCTAIVSDSLSAAKKWTNNNIGLLFVDGLHTEEQCRLDFEAFMPFLYPGSVIAFHDYEVEGFGVKAVVTHLTSSGVLELTSIVDSMAVTVLKGK